MEKVSREHIECDFCGKPGPPSKCARCHGSHYCSRDCQQKDWKAHENGCKIWVEMKKQRKEYDAPAEPRSGEEELCAICLEETLANAVVFDCNHAFCYDCIKEYQQNIRSEKGGDGSCPCCRKAMPAVEIKAFERAELYEYRAQKYERGSDDWKKYIGLALADLDTVIRKNEDCTMAYLLKAQCLAAMDPEMSIKLFEKAEKMNEKYVELEVEAEVNALRERVIEAHASHDIAALYELKHALKEKRDLLLRQRLGFIGDGNLYQLHVYKGEAYSKMGKWDEAMQEYERAFDYKDIHVSILQKAVIGLCKALYKLGEYDKIISLGKNLLLTPECRIAEGVHEYVSLAQKEKGDTDAARRTMSRAVLHEAPWAKENKARNLKILREL